MKQQITVTAVLLLLCSPTMSAWGQQYYLYEPKPVTAGEKDRGKDGVLVTEVQVRRGDTLYHISRKFSGRGMYYPQILLFNKINNPNMIHPGSIFRVPVTRDPEPSAPDAAAPARKTGSKSNLHEIPAEKSAVPAAAPPAKKTGSKSNLHEITVDKSDIPATASSASGHKPQPRKSTVSNVAEIPLNDLKATQEKKDRKRLYNKKGSVKDVAADNKKAPARQKGSETAPAGDNSATPQQLFEKAINAYKQGNYAGAIDLFDRYLANNSNSPLAADASLYKAECYLKLSSR